LVKKEIIMKKLNISIFAACMVIGLMVLTFVSCDDGSSSGRGSGPFTVTYRLGEGRGTPPSQTPVAGGTPITLQGQGEMTHPDGKILDVWREHHGNDYKPGERYPVTENVTFTAQWKIDPNVVINPFLGTWRGTWTDGGNQTIILNFQDREFNWIISGSSWGFDGTYTFSGNRATLYATDTNGNGTAEISSNGDLILTCGYFGGNNQVICRK
jgi:hypothetical protein